MITEKMVEIAIEEMKKKHQIDTDGKQSGCKKKKKKEWGKTDEQKFNSVI